MTILVATITKIFYRCNMTEKEKLEKYYNILPKTNKDKAFTNALEYYKEIFINRFIWENLPDKDDCYLNSEMIEASIFDNNLAGWKSKIFNEVLILPYVGVSPINLYGKFTSFNLLGVTKQFNNIPYNELVFLYNNDSKIIPARYIAQQCDLLTQIDYAIRTNTLAQVSPFSITADDENYLSAVNMLEKLFQQENFILKRKTNKEIFDVEKMLKFDIAYIGDKLLDARDRIDGKILNYIGINSVGAEKKQRLLVDEINANDELINNNFYAALDSRRKFCKEINARHGTNIKVRARTYVEGGVLYAANVENGSNNDRDVD